MNTARAFMALMVLVASSCTAMLPNLTPDPWEYPDLSNTGCPDLSGVYNNSTVQSALGVYLGTFIDAVTLKQSDLEIEIKGKAAKDSRLLGCDPCEDGEIERIKNQEIIIRKGDVIKKTIPIYRPSKISHKYNDDFFLERSCGCSRGKYICHSIDRSLANGERLFNTLIQAETIVSKDKNGNLEVTRIEKSKGGKVLGRTGSDPGRRRSWIIEKVSPPSEKSSP